MKYIVNKDIQASEIADLRQSVGWNSMEKELNNHNLKDYCNLACYVEDLLVGYISVVSNGVTDAYIQDLMVRPKFQKQGIGTELMNRTIKYLKDNSIYMISVIYGTQELKAYYERFGFYTMLCGQLETHCSE